MLTTLKSLLGIKTVKKLSTLSKVVFLMGHKLIVEFKTKFMPKMSFLKQGLVNCGKQVILSCFDEVESDRNYFSTSVAHTSDGAKYILDIVYSSRNDPYARVKLASLGLLKHKIIYEKIIENEKEYLTRNSMYLFGDNMEITDLERDIYGMVKYTDHILNFKK